MSIFKVSKEIIRDVIPIEGASMIELVKVLGWDVVVRKGEFKVGDECIFVPVGGVLPDSLVDNLCLRGMFHGKRNLVKTVKIRGVYSQGLVIPVSVLPYSFRYAVGEDVKQVLGIDRYDPELPVQMNGKCRPKDERFIEYTEIENIRNWPGVLVGGELVVVHEKVHGMNSRFGCFGCFGNGDSDSYYVGSHHQSLLRSDQNVYWRIFTRYKIDRYLKDNMVIFGEIYGPGIQKKMQYGQKRVSLVIFDVWHDGRYWDWGKLRNFCETYDLPMAPLLYEGPWSDDLLMLARGDTKVKGDKVGYTPHIREGVVVRPVRERAVIDLGRVILKGLNEDYLLSRKT